MLTDEQYETLVDEQWELFPTIAQRVIEFGIVDDADLYELLKELATALLARQRLAAEVRELLVRLRSGASWYDEELQEQIGAVEEVLEADDATE